MRCSALLSVLSVSGKAEPCGINLWIAVQDYVSEFSSALSHNPRLSPFFLNQFGLVSFSSFVYFPQGCIFPLTKMINSAPLL